VVVLITSRKGGVGKTTICANLGAAFAERGLSTLMVDCDFGVRCLDLLCKVTDDVLFDLGDLAMGRTETEKATVKVREKLDMIASPGEDVSRSERFSEGLKAVFDSLIAAYDVVLFDTPRDSLVQIAEGLGDNRQNTAAITVVNPYETAVRAAELTGRELVSLGINNVRLAINGFDPKEMRRGTQPSVVDLIDLTGLPLVGAIMSDRTLNIRPISKNAPTRRAFANIAARLCGENIPLLDGVRGLNRRKLINI